MPNNAAGSQPVPSDSASGSPVRSDAPPQALVDAIAGQLEALVGMLPIVVPDSWISGAAVSLALTVRLVEMSRAIASTCAAPRVVPGLTEQDLQMVIASLHGAVSRARRRVVRLDYLARAEALIALFEAASRSGRNPLATAESFTIENTTITGAVRAHVEGR